MAEYPIDNAFYVDLASRRAVLEAEGVAPDEFLADTLRLF